MTVLILGSQGNLGTQLVKVFSTEYTTVAWDKEDLDVLDFSVAQKKISELKPDLIINTIAYNAVDACEQAESYDLAVQLNINWPRVLAEIAYQLSATLIHYSTDYVFSGTEEKREFSETETPNPINKYGESKFAGERELLKWGELGLSYYLIRSSKLFGPQGTSPLAKPSFFSIIARQAQEKAELQIVNEELSCFTYTVDLALATKRLWELETPVGIYHLVNEGAYTWYEGARKFFQLLDWPVKLRAVRSEDNRREARRPKFSVLKNNRLKKMRPFREALSEYLKEGL
ncbi:MAG: SDR family oxidoreductase [Patescibacteria group bacterium]|jgi:dTDP-4-dehydrorhamnose reductase